MAQHGNYEDGAATLQRNEDRLRRQQQAREADRRAAARELRGRRSI